MNFPSLPNRHAGFSLLEVLVAFCITAMAVGVIFQIYGKGSTALILGEEYAQAVAIAESRLAEWHTESNGQVARSGAEGRYAWHVEVSEYGDADAADSEKAFELDLVVVEVRWDSRGESRVVRVQTLKPGVSS